MGEYPITASPMIGVPVGTILPYVGPLNILPPDWKPCDGSLIKDPSSPFNNLNLPDLRDDRFLMGVQVPGRIGEKAGNNGIPSDGSHSHNLHNAGGHAHGGATAQFMGYLQGKINWGRQGEQGDPFMPTYQIVQDGDHAHGIDANGTHNHGGENRPLYYGVYYIIRIK